MKKTDDSKRNLDVELQLKRGTLEMTFSPAAYETYTHAIYQYYENHDTKIY